MTLNPTHSRRYFKTILTRTYLKLSSSGVPAISHVLRSWSGRKKERAEEEGESRGRSREQGKKERAEVEGEGGGRKIERRKEREGRREKEGKRTKEREEKKERSKERY